MLKYRSLAELKILSIHIHPHFLRKATASTLNIKYAWLMTSRPALPTQQARPFTLYQTDVPENRVRSVGRLRGYKADLGVSHGWLDIRSTMVPLCATFPTE
jgi:hypothetical protein